MREIIIGGSGVAALGLAIIGSTWLWILATQDDGGGANIGAGLLGLLGIVVVVISLVMALIGLGVVVVRRIRA